MSAKVAMLRAEPDLVPVVKALHTLTDAIGAMEDRDVKAALANFLIPLYTTLDFNAAALASLDRAAVDLPQ